MEVFKKLKIKSNTEQLDNVYMYMLEYDFLKEFKKLKQDYLNKLIEEKNKASNIIYFSDIKRRA